MMNYFAIAALAIAGASARGLDAVQQNVAQAASGSAPAQQQKILGGDTKSQTPVYVQCEYGMEGCDPRTWGPNNGDDTNYEVCYYVGDDFNNSQVRGRGKPVPTGDDPASWTRVQIDFHKHAAKHGQTIQLVNRQYFFVTIDMDTFDNVFDWGLDALPEDSPVIHKYDYSDTYHNVQGWFFQVEGCMDQELVHFTGKGAPINGVSTEDRYLSVNVIVGQDP